ncbi:lipid droplet associated hydrolase sturkopf [Aphomia sociella]
MCIPGNPGYTDFYIEFASELHESTGLPVCVVGHAGHNEIQDGPQGISKTDDLYNLNGQVAHKLDFINNHIDKKSKLHLIGHSIGAWLIIDLLEKDPSLTDRVASVNLLFPTIQKLAESPNGKRVIKYVKNFDTLLVFLMKLISYLPNFLKRTL